MMLAWGCGTETRKVRRFDEFWVHSNVKVYEEPLAESTIVIPEH